MNGETAFMVACKVNNMDAAALLVQHGADANARDRVGRTVLMCAVMSQQAEVVDALMAVGVVDQEERDEQLAELEKENVRKAGKREQIEAAGQPVPKEYMGVGKLPPIPPQVDVNLQDDWGYSALMHAAKYPAMNEVAQKLMAKGTDLLIQDRHGNTAVALAAQKSNLALVQKLILAGADVKHKNDDKMSTLDIVGESIAWDLERYIVKQKPEPAKPQRSDYTWRPTVVDIHSDDVQKYRDPPDRGGTDELSMMHSEEGSFAEGMSIASAKYDAPGERLAAHMEKNEE